MLNQAVAKQLTKKGIAAWKDVSAKFTPDGRFHFKGTAYFESLGDLVSKDKTFDFNLEQFTLSKENGFKLAVHKSEPIKKGPPPDFKKMTKQEKEDFVLKQRIKYQSAKPIMTAMFTDLRIKTEIRFPGDVQESKGFKKTGARIVSRNLDGGVILKAMNKLMAQDNAALQKMFMEAKNPDVIEAFGASRVHARRLRDGPQGRHAAVRFRQGSR